MIPLPTKPEKLHGGQSHEVVLDDQARRMLLANPHSLPIIFYFIKECIKGCFLIVLFCVISEVKITLKYPKILWKKFNLNTIVPPFPKCCELRQKTMQI